MRWFKVIEENMSLLEVEGVKEEEEEAEGLI